MMRARTGSAPRRGVVDLVDGVHGLKGTREVTGYNSHNVAGSLEENGAAEADDAGAGQR